MVKRSRSRSGAFAVYLEIPRQFAVDVDVRKFLDRLRIAVGLRLRAGAGQDIAEEYGLGQITGSATNATTEIRNTARSGAAYFGRNADRVLRQTIPEVIREWLDDAVPKSGDGVGTPVRANTGGGPLPR